jgi:hypothetical protein
VTPQGFFETHSQNILVNFTADYNVVQGEGQPYPGDATRDTHSKYVRDVLLASGLLPNPLPDSPAIDAGLDFRPIFTGSRCPPASTDTSKARLRTPERSRSANSAPRIDKIVASSKRLDIGERMTMKAGSYPGLVNPVLYLLDIEPSVGGYIEVC